MASRRYLVALWMLSAVVVEGVIPKDVIFKMDRYCGSSIKEYAIINITTNAFLDIKGACAGGYVNFTTTDYVHRFLNISYPGSSNPTSCVFPKRVGSEMYSLQVFAAFGERHVFVAEVEERTTITCTFEPLTVANTPLIHPVENTYMSNIEVQGNVGAVTPSQVTVFVCDIKGHDMTNNHVGLGRLVQIAVTLANGSEVAVRPNHCEAVGQITGQTYAVLVAGCGDGLIFPRNKGFDVSGKTALSPYFEMFELQGEHMMTFSCNVTVCHTNCDGSTCTNARRRRSLPDTNTEHDVHREIQVESAVLYTAEKTEPAVSHLHSLVFGSGANSFAYTISGFLVVLMCLFEQQA